MGWAVEQYMAGFCKGILSSVISVCHSLFMDKIINMETHVLLIELDTITHSYFISSIECDTFIQMCQATHNVKY